MRTLTDGRRTDAQRIDGDSVAHELIPLGVATLMINLKLYGQNANPGRLTDVARTIGALAPLYTYNSDGSEIRRLSDEELLSGFFRKAGGELHFTDGRAPIANIAVSNSDIQLVTGMLASYASAEDRRSPA